MTRRVSLPLLLPASAFVIERIPRGKVLPAGIVPVLLAALLGIPFWPTTGMAQNRKAPPGMFKDLDDQTLGGALVVHGTQLFIDDDVIGDMRGVNKRLNQPVKHPKNPLLKRDKPWEVSGPGYGTVIYDTDEKRFKMWYETINQSGNETNDTSFILYATSSDGLVWDKPIVDRSGKTNRVRQPPEYGLVGAGIFKDPVERNPARRYKMLFSCKPDKKSSSLRTSAAFSEDGLSWTTSPVREMIPFSDTQCCPFWDRRRQRYVAYMRFGPPNTRIISRTESEDFLHWSPKVTVLPQTKMDLPLSTQFYQMSGFAYGNVHLGLIAAYHSESLGPITPKTPWTDRKDLQLVYSRNGLTWNRVGKQGAIPPHALKQDRDWKQIALDAVFVPYGEKDKDWDWGTVSPIYTPEPIVVGDEIWFYYTGINAKNWWTWSGDPPRKDPNPKEPNTGIGLAKLRIDGFVSVEAGENEGTLTTKPLVFLGDTLEINANARGGSLTVEALDAEGKPIAGFGKADGDPITSDSVRHAVSWKKNADCHLLQGRPLRLRFHLRNAKLYSFTPRIKHNHYLQSYD